MSVKMECEILRVMKEEVFTDPQRWTKGTSARTVEGFSIPATNPLATAFCWLGACDYAFFRLRDSFNALALVEAQNRVNNNLRDRLGIASIATWNDYTATFTDIQEQLAKCQEELCTSL